MAALIGPATVLRRLIFILVAAGVVAQDRAAPVQVWLDDGRIPPQYSDKYVFLTRDKHTIVVLAPERPETGIAGPKKIVRVLLWNNILPSVSVSLERVSSGELRYHYTIDNGKEAQDPIGKFSLVVPASIADLKFSHSPPNGGTAWGGPGVHVAGGPAVAVHDVLQKPPGQYRTWFYHGDNLIQPGTSLGGFELQSSYLPGVTTAWFSGGRLIEFDQSWPREIFEQVELLEHRRWREVSVVTAGPMFPPQTPKEVIIETFRQDLEQMIKSGWLGGSSNFVQEVKRTLAELRENPTKQQVLKSPTQTTAETAVAVALEGSLGIMRRSQ